MVQRIAPIPVTKVNVVQPVRTKRAAPANLFEAIGRAQAKRTKKIDSMLTRFKKYNAANNTLWNENDITFLNNLNENDEKNLRARAKKYGVKLTYKTKDGRIKKRSVARLKELIAKKKNKANAFEALKSEARALGVPLTRIHPPSVKRTAMTANELQNAIRNVKANRQAKANALAKKKANAEAAKKAKANALAKKKANAAAAREAAKKAKANALAKKKANAAAAKAQTKNDQYIKVAVSKMMDSIIKKNKRRKSRAQARANKAFVKKEVQGMFNRLKKMNTYNSNSNESTMTTA
jgi:chemotaxis protein histidine kinase CheA